jgi:hypothetical protein
MHATAPDAAGIVTAGPISASYLAAIGVRLAIALYYEKNSPSTASVGRPHRLFGFEQEIVESGVREIFVALLKQPQLLEQGKFSSAVQFQYGSRQEDEGARSVHCMVFRTSFALQAFVVRDLGEIDRLA